MTHYSIKLIGNEQTDTFPWAVINTESNVIIERYTDRSLADQIADRLNQGTPADCIGDEAWEQMPKLVTIIEQDGTHHTLTEQELNVEEYVKLFPLLVAAVSDESRPLSEREDAWNTIYHHIHHSFL